MENQIEKPESEQQITVPVIYDIEEISVELASISKNDIDVDSLGEITI